MITIKNTHQIESLRAAGWIVAETFDVIAPLVKPGAVLADIDCAAEDFILSKGAETLYKGIQQRPRQRPFPGVITASVNHEICHGIPDGRVLKDGDIVGIDIGLKFKGWCGDACKTFIVGKAEKETARLVETARQSLFKGIHAAVAGQPIGAIGEAIQQFAESKGYSVVREYGGHGIGRELWEEPFIPHIGPASRGPRIKVGMVLNIEPMINIGRADTRLMPDEWTVETADRSLSAQFEHTIAITDNGPDILTVVKS
jgi:methionyl aminopeptidase